MRAPIQTLSSLLQMARAHPRWTAWGLVAVLAAMVAWSSPVSPLALGQADVTYGSGRPFDALQAYDRIGRWNPWASIRLKADERAATIAAVDLDDPSLSRTYLERILAEPTASGAVKANAWERVGHVAWTTENHAEEAAGAFQMSYKLDMMAPEAERRLIAAARARTDAGDIGPALQAWEQVANRIPAQRGLARVNQASLLLAEGEIQDALSAYDQAAAFTDDPTLVQVARMGAATCKERLGQVDAALADLDQADLPAAVATERQRRLEERKPGK